MPTAMSERADGASVPAANRLSASYLLKRILIAVLILTIGVGSLAWLTYASIDQTADLASRNETGSLP
ncbi:MAG: hypothetical protein NW216_03645 [Hyphomicrobium sp.]|nr:hypothetical protein [Hyphomicrobium sp.]